MHNPAALVPILFTPLIVGLSMLSWVSVRQVHRANGRKAVEAEIAHRGERVVAIENVPLHALVDRAGLNSGLVYRVTSRSPQDRETVSLLAFEPGLAARFGGPGGLKRLAHGIWIPA